MPAIVDVYKESLSAYLQLDNLMRFVARSDEEGDIAKVHKKTRFVLAEVLDMQRLDRVEDLGSGALIAAGGLAGTAYWVVMYPLDVIKSKLQTQSYRQPSRGIIECSRFVLQKEGMKGLYCGLFPCLLRSFPANAASFVAYELALQTIASYTTSSLKHKSG